MKGDIEEIVRTEKNRKIYEEYTLEQFDKANSTSSYIEDQPKPPALLRSKKKTTLLDSVPWSAIGDVFGVLLLIVASLGGGYLLLKLIFKF
ncbi:hypothetical protein HYS03_01375 [Candidatus Woesebacteria bacterium]|nr:hypothetical protein [Candidatus Woesebacteria bacterium]QQG47310.1 MAG: hypothetical protein HY044_04255 [Candidatus Woesebacteria bacterium]